jgi:predicted PurR-regulated permease PerM
VSGLVVPLVIAVVIGMLASPLVDMLERRKVPRGVGALLVLVAIVVVIVGAAVIAVNGIIDQGDEISRQLTAGLESVDHWLEDLDVDGGAAGDWLDQGKQFGVDLIPGLAGWFTTAFSGVVSFLVGSFLCLFLLYYVLVDWVRLRDWVGSHLGVPPDLGITVVGDATAVIRQGFAALTVSSLTTAVIIGATMVALGVPLAFTVALVTFVTSYIPYLGAIFSAVFACLVALGSAGVTEALILLVVILIVQNRVQTVVTTKLTSDRLAIHPIANIISTLIGASLAGLLGGDALGAGSCHGHSDHPPDQPIRAACDRGDWRRATRQQLASSRWSFRKNTITRLTRVAIPRTPRQMMRRRRAVAHPVGSFTH